jgi:hypothetical protein
MPSSDNSAPPPDLRIIDIDRAYPHEEHDSQRALPLIEKLQDAEVVINPPVVAEIGEDKFVILDGANRCFSFKQLGYPHILVQVTSYDSGYVELDTWQHVISGWDVMRFLQQVRELSGIELRTGHAERALACITTLDGEKWSVMSYIETTAERNAHLRDLVRIYQTQARLYRTAIQDVDTIWPLYPDAIAAIEFPNYTPADIIAAAREHAYLPPGISRHIIHGRALRVNYPLEPLRDPKTSLKEKNETLQEWIRQKLAQREIRYYAEAVYHFDE